MLLNHILYILNLGLISGCSWKLLLGLVVVDINIARPSGNCIAPAFVSFRKLRQCHRGFIAAADAGRFERVEDRERAGVTGALLDVVFNVADL